MTGLVMKYFVLKPAGDHAYAKASRKAMETYAREIREENPELHFQLTEWIERESTKSQIRFRSGEPKDER